ncbi:hypothetical protein [Rhodopila globiformis]|uniref:Uncharacterized protein n=1 Tax=Rhodopila globiformis TaxID=1071 RepID=A0A2S6NP73_RHOGL|nr:hypothetical protein [Rhodopila globiformis]PPQ40146.1 hypothetical protein CCS01_00770 [Rhodopila globiformis]
MQIDKQMTERYSYERIVDSICALNWTALTREDLSNVARAYYYFSVQFRENLEIACRLFPGDPKLQELSRGECDTDNLSPWPGVAQPNETLDHDEFMRRLLLLSSTASDRRGYIDETGSRYLQTIRAMDLDTRARSIASYEDGGLERMFRAMLTAPHWDDALLQAFRHFLVQHIAFDADPDAGHGALSRHLAPNDQILPLWLECRQLLLAAAPALLS